MSERADDEVADMVELTEGVHGLIAGGAFPLIDPNG